MLLELFSLLQRALHVHRGIKPPETWAQSYYFKAVFKHCNGGELFSILVSSAWVNNWSTECVFEQHANQSSDVTSVEPDWRSRRQMGNGARDADKKSPSCKILFTYYYLV